MILQHFWTKYPEEKDTYKENNLKRKRENRKQKVSIPRNHDKTCVPSNDNDVSSDVTLENVSTAINRLGKHRQVMLVNKISCRSVSSHKGWEVEKGSFS